VVCPKPPKTVLTRFRTPPDLLSDRLRLRTRAHRAIWPRGRLDAIRTTTSRSDPRLCEAPFRERLPVWATNSDIPMRSDVGRTRRKAREYEQRPSEISKRSMPRWWALHCQQH
jgi:hypothetical protein